MTWFEISIRDIDPPLPGPLYCYNFLIIRAAKLRMLTFQTYLRNWARSANTFSNYFVPKNNFSLKKTLWIFFSQKTFLNQNFPKNFFEPKFPKKLFWTILFPKNYFFPKNIFQRFFPKNFLNYFFPKNFFELFFFQKNYFQILFPEQSFQCLYSVYIKKNRTNSHKSIDNQQKITCV